jgi:hypothetical protein
VSELIFRSGSVPKVSSDKSLCYFFCLLNIQMALLVLYITKEAVVLFEQNLVEIAKPNRGHKLDHLSFGQLWLSKCF